MPKIDFPFNRRGTFPIDKVFNLTKAQMLSVNDNLMPDMYFAVCLDDGKFYLYDKSIAVPSPETGKFYPYNPGVIQSDWAENDDTEDAYIKNRTHYEQQSGVEAEVYRGDARAGTTMGNSHNTGIIRLEAGKLYNVALQSKLSAYRKVYSNIEAESVTPDGYTFPILCLRRNWPIIGAQSSVPANAFCLVANCDGTFELTSNDVNNSVELIVTTSEGVVHKLDSKYLGPDAVNVFTDWAENNPMRENYIRNRTHWTENVVALNETCQVADGVSYYNSSNDVFIRDSLEVGKLYNVTFYDGYAIKQFAGVECEQKSSLVFVLRKNYNLNGSPDSGITRDAFYVAAYSDETEIKCKDICGQFVFVTIEAVEETVHKLDRKYLPGAGVSIVDVAQLPVENIDSAAFYRVTESLPITMYKLYTYDGGGNWTNRSVILISQENYDLLSSDQKNDGTLYIVDSFEQWQSEFDYDTLSHKPSIGGITLQGALSQEDLDMFTRQEVVDLIDAKSNAEFVDQLPTTLVRNTWYYSRKFADLSPVPDDKRALYIVDKNGVLYYGGIMGDLNMSGYYSKNETDNLLDGKQDILQSGVNIKTINNQSILGSGNLDIEGGDMSNYYNKAESNALLAEKQDKLVDAGSYYGAPADSDKLSGLYTEDNKLKYKFINFQQLAGWFMNRLSKTTINSSSTDGEFPTSKAVWNFGATKNNTIVRTNSTTDPTDSDYIGDMVTNAAFKRWTFSKVYGWLANKLSKSITSSSTDTQIPSAKAVWTLLTPTATNLTMTLSATNQISVYGNNSKLITVGNLKIVVINMIFKTAVAFSGSANYITLGCTFTGTIKTELAKVKTTDSAHIPISAICQSGDTPVDGFDFYNVTSSSANIRISARNGLYANAYIRVQGTFIYTT